MAPKRKAKTAANASPAKAAPEGRILRSSGRTTRSKSVAARFVSLEDTQKKSPAKKQKKSPAKKQKVEKKAEPKDKAKKAAEGEGPSGAGGSDDPKGKGKKAAEPEGGASDVADESEEEVEDDPNRTVIVVEHCTQCKSFLKRATQVKVGLEGSEAIDVVVKLNPEKPRKGCFEIRQQGGQTYISLLDMDRPFKPMKDLKMDKVIADIVADLSNAG